MKIDNSRNYLSGLILCNFVPELIINLVFSAAGSRIVRSFQKV